MEAPLCARITDAIGARATNLAGLTSLAESVALFSRCRVSVTNDSGGMHLAAAAGSRVVAVFGLTDPSRTGPLGEGHNVVQAKGVSAARDIPRDSPEARAALESISVEQVESAAERAAEGLHP
jgi:ADP-heptose:LPS heptosyltransferase